MAFINVTKSFLTLAGTLAVCLMTGYVSWYAALPGMPVWYGNLLKPVLSPSPGFLSSAWMISFLFMGLALFFIVQSGIRQHDVSFGLILFCLQLLFTLAWGYAFFNLHAIFTAFMFIIGLWAALLSTVIQVFRFSVYGGMLLVPYFIWVCYLAYLNYGVMVLNNLVYAI